MTPTQPGRNDRCPCGSGKKYKHCCLQHRYEGDAARRRLRLAEGRVVDGTLAFAAATWGEALLHDAWADFWNDEAPDDMVGTPEFEQMFLPWFVFSYVPDPRAGDGEDEHAARDGEPGARIGTPATRRLPFDERRARAFRPERPLALEWMATHAGPRDPLDWQYAETAARSPLSVFVVEGVVPGGSIDIKDVLTGAHFHVLESGASRSMRAADLLFASVLTIDGVSVMFGASPYAVPADWHTRIIDWRERLQKRKWNRQDLVEYDIEIRALYFHIREALLNPTPPQLQNTDGDPLEMITLRFDLTVSVAGSRGSTSGSPRWGTRRRAKRRARRRDASVWRRCSADSASERSRTRSQRARRCERCGVSWDSSSTAMAFGSQEWPQWPWRRRTLATAPTSSSPPPRVR